MTQQTIMLSSGLELTAEEVLEGFRLLAASEVSWPLLGPRDKLKAFVEMAFVAYEQEPDE